MNPPQKSFRPSDFSRRDFPRLLLAFLLVTAFSLLIGWLPAQVLPEHLHTFVLGLLLGLFVGWGACSWFARRAARSAAAETGPNRE